MTSRYSAYLLSLVQRDETLVMLSLMALLLVSAWVLVDWVPKRFQVPLRNIYLIGGLILFLIQLALCLIGG